MLPAANSVAVSPTNNLVSQVSQMYRVARCTDMFAPDCDFAHHAQRIGIILFNGATDYKAVALKSANRRR